MFKVSLTLKFGAFLLLLLFASCKTREKLTYFQKKAEPRAVETNFTPVFQIDDFLSIIVSSIDPETVEIFNAPTEGNMGQTGYEQGNPAPIGYLIDADGNANLPVIGAVTLAGLNRKEAVAMLQEKLSAYIKQPIVQIQILNYKVTVLGDVARPGTYKIPNERITLMEAIGLAGDLKITGQRNNVLVVREENNERKEYRVDLTSSEVFSSPVYYLKQNDLVYVEPNFKARSESSFIRSTSGIFISLTSLFITTITLISK